MPSSISALFSLSYNFVNFVGLFFSGKVLQLSAPPALKYTPTRTTEIFLEPTRCLPSPASLANGPAKFLGPYSILVLLAILIFTALASIICSKGFYAPRRPRCAPNLSAPPQPDHDPEINPRRYGSSPSKPPEPDLGITSCEYARLFWFIFAFSLHMVIYVTSLSPAPTTGMSTSDLFSKSTLRLMEMVESSILDSLDVVDSYIQHICIHGSQYLQFLCFAIAGHSLGFSIVFIHRYSRAFVYRHRRLIIPFVEDNWPPTCVLLITGLVYILRPQFNWIPWMHYYFLCRDGYLPSLSRVLEIVFSLLLMPPETLVIPASLAIWAAALGLWTVAVIFVTLPSSTRRIARELDLPVVITVLCCSTFITTILYCDALITFARKEQKGMSQNVKNWIRDRIDQALTSEEARTEVWEFYLPSMERHKSWRVTQSQEFYKIMRLLWTTAGTTWKTLHWGQKFLIIGPAAIYYGYFYVMPVVRNITLRIKYWKYQRRWH